MCETVHTKYFHYSFLKEILNEFHERYEFSISYICNKTDIWSCY